MKETAAAQESIRIEQMDSPAYYLPELVREQAWDRIINPLGYSPIDPNLGKANVRWQHFSSVYRILRAREPWSWMFAGVLDAPETRPDGSKDRVGKCKFPWPGIFIVDGEGPYVRGYMRVDGPPNEVYGDTPAVGYTVTVRSERRRSGATARLLTAGKLALEVYDEALDSGIGFSDSGGAFAQKLAQLGIWTPYMDEAGNQRYTLLPSAVQHIEFESPAENIA